MPSTDGNLLHVSAPRASARASTLTVPSLLGNGMPVARIVP